MVRKLRRPSVNRIRLVLLLVLSVHFQKVLCLVVDQITQVLTESSNDVVLTFKNINFTNITELDMLARKAMEKIHDDLDQNDDGNVSVSEGAKYINRGEFEETANDNLPSFETDKDGRITQVEFWDAWIQSEVHNWTASQMAEWLSYDVDLPQYASKFKQYAISGAAMPIFSDESQIILPRLGIKNKAHRRKIYIKAIELVLFGLPKSKPNFLKDVLLTVSLALALGGILFGMHFRRKATDAVFTMQDKLNSLQKELQKVDDEEDAIWMKDFASSADDREASDKNTEHSGSTTSLNSESTTHNRLMEAHEELTEMKSLLENAEERLRVSEKKWSAPSRLLSCLKITYQVEMKLHELKRQQAYKKVEQTKVQFQKMKKKVSLFSSVQFIHSRQVDSFDVEVQLAKDALRAVQHDSYEHKKRWAELESICRCKFVVTSSMTSPPAKATLRKSAVRRRSPAPPIQRHPSIDLDDASPVTTSTPGSSESAEQLDKLGSLRELSLERSTRRSSSDNTRKNHSFPSLTEVSDRQEQRSEIIVSRSSSDCTIRPTSNKLGDLKAKEPARSDSYPPNGHGPERKQAAISHSSTSASLTNYLNKNGSTLPRKSKSPKPLRKSSDATPKTQSEVVAPVGDTVDGARPAALALATVKKTPSVQSLPDLSAKSKVNGERAATGTVKAGSLLTTGENGDTTKKHKRPFSFFRIKKSK